MLSETLAATSEIIGEWLAYAGGLAWRVGGPALEPVVRLVSGGPAAGDEAAGAEPPATDEETLQAHAAEARFRLGAIRTVPRVRACAAEPAELAHAHGTDRLVLLARDPGSIFAYWEISPAARTAALAVLGAETRDA